MCDAWQIFIFADLHWRAGGPVLPLLKRPWIVETDPDKADFIIATQRSRCAENKPVVLIDEVKRFDRTFAWIYARKELWD